MRRAHRARPRVQSPDDHEDPKRFQATAERKSDAGYGLPQGRGRHLPGAGYSNRATIPWVLHDSAAHPGSPSVADAAVDQLANDVGVAGVSRRLLQHVHEDPAHRLVRAMRARHPRVE